MRVIAASVREIAWTLDGRGAAARRSERHGLVLEVHTECGVVGRGEASPLRGLSRESLDDARAALADFATRAPLEIDSAESILELARAFVAAPSARFAIETALLDALSQARDTTIAELISRAESPSISTNVVIDTAEDARDAFAAGVRVLKLKVHEPAGDLISISRTGVPAPAELISPISPSRSGNLISPISPVAHDLLSISESGREIVRAVERVAIAVPGAILRLDANRTWPRHEVAARLHALAGVARRTNTMIEYVEEPCAEAYELLVAGAPLPIALDESLVELTPDQLTHALTSSTLGALVLKPTLLGGFAACLELAARARAAGVVAIVTHALESPIGGAACYELARVVSGTRAHGVDAHVGATHERTPEITPAPARSNDGSNGTHVGEAVEIVVATAEQFTVDRVRRALDGRRPIALLHAGLPDAEIARQRVAVEAAELDDGDLVLFTSGSTGQARGVVLSRTAIEAAVAASAERLGWRDDDRWLLALSMAHAGGAAVVARCHFAGKPIEHLERWGHAAAAEALERCTLASLVPTQLAELLEDPAWRPPSRLRAVLLGGAPASGALLAAARERGVPVLATYGMTESFGQLATAKRSEGRLEPLRGVELIAGTRAVPAPIRVRAPMLATRYLDGTPIAPEHVTSDLGFVEDGALHVVGRADDMIITGGENVSPTQVEAALVAMPGVHAACAFGIPDERWGQIVAAAIVAERFDLEAIASALPAHARPRELAIVRELPMLATGKLDRRAAARLPRERVRY